MESKISKLISLLFQPLLMPSLALLIMLQMPVYFAVVLPKEAKWILLGIVFFTTFFLPVTFILFMVRRGMVRSLYIDSREERTVPYGITVVFFILAYYLLKQLELSPVYSYFMIGAILLIIVVFLINFFWKISSHMAAVGALTGLAIGLSYYLGMFFINLIVVALFISGLVGYSRLRLHAHTPAQVDAGFLLGALLEASIFIIYY